MYKRGNTHVGTRTRTHTLKKLETLVISYSLFIHSNLLPNLTVLLSHESQLFSIVTTARALLRVSEFPHDYYGEKYTINQIITDVTDYDLTEVLVYNFTH